MSQTMSRAVAGYHMLMILSAIDGKFNGKEDRVIREYMEENYGGLVDLQQEMGVIGSLSAEDYPVHFNNAMNHFYMHSSKNERNHFLDMATRLVAADKQISPRENLFLNELYNAWEEEVAD
jgi:uncharacterized tellurite resistance protein B-like protein